MSQPQRIDVHHHPSPPSYIAAREGGDAANPPRRSWTAQKSLDSMDQGGVATAILSLPHSVSIWPDRGAQARALAREWNEFMAKLASDHPGRFGIYATVPILDVEGSLREIEYAQAAHVWAMASLTRLVPISQNVFGTDYPYRTAEETAGMLKECGCFGDSDLRAIDCENAWRLMPRWKPG